jgi:4-hydroxy-2-oxoheptanedioate aldolase
MPSPAVSEILAQSGFDFQILDCEHGHYDYHSLYADLLACEANHCLAWVRVSGNDKVEVQRCLDLGASGIVFPGLADLAAVERCADWMDYSPKGNRGYNPFVRSSRYGVNETEGSPAEPLLVPIIETLSAVEALDQILALERIGMVYIGTYDLSAQLGVAGQMQHASVVDTVGHILKSCQRHGIRVGAMALNPAKEAELRSMGVETIVHGVESHRMKDCFTAIARGPDPS